MPILIFLSYLLGQPVIVTIVPMQPPRIEIQAIPTPEKKPEAEAVGGCYSVICPA